MSPIGPSCGASFTSVTVTVNASSYVSPGVPPSVTRTVTSYTPSPSASVGFSKSSTPSVNTRLFVPSMLNFAESAPPWIVNVNVLNGADVSGSAPLNTPTACPLLVSVFSATVSADNQMSVGALFVESLETKTSNPPALVRLNVPGSGSKSAVAEK